MNKKKLETKHILLLILVLFFIPNIFIIFLQENVWWDSSVYIGMGKYLYSHGDSGFWEESRPMVLPLILGLIWKLGLNVVFFGKILSVLFSLGAIIMTYLIAKEIFGEKTALLSSAILELTPTFFFFSKVTLTGIPSTFFVLTSIYFLIRKNYLFSGLLLGMGFMTRFLQLIAFAIILAALFYYYKDKKELWKKVSHILVGFLIPVVPFLAFNFLMYGNAVQPFLTQLFLTKNTGWMYFEPFWFYFLGLLKENYLYLFSLAGIVLLVKEKKTFWGSVLLYLLLALFLFFSLVEHKEMRFLTVLMPYLFIIASFGIIKMFNHVKNANLKYAAAFILSIIFISQSAFVIYSLEQSEISKGNPHREMQEYVERENLGNIWISNPSYAAHSNKKINNLIYYPTFNMEKVEVLNSRIENAGSILINTCDIPCHPENSKCSEFKEDFLDILKNRFETEHGKNENGCTELILSNN